MLAKKPVVFLHIGAPKTGTTFLQHLMLANKGSLAEAGYNFAGRNWAAQVRAAQDVLGHSEGDPVIEARSAGAWSKIVDEMLAYEGNGSIFSMEFLAFAEQEQAERIVASLGDAEVHLIVTVRDTTATLPAQWQTRTHNRSVESWPAFVGGAMRSVEHPRRARGLHGIVSRAAEAAGTVLRLPGRVWSWLVRRVSAVVRGPHPPLPETADRAFQGSQGIPRMLDIWGGLLPAEHLHIVTVPPSGSDPLLLWRRFAEVLGVDPAVCSRPAEKSNASLGQASAELMRRVNLALPGVQRSDYNPTLKEYLALRVLADRAKSEARPVLDLRTRRFAVGWNARIREAIVASGAHLVGDLEDLPTQLPAGFEATASLTLTEPSDQEVLEAAATAFDGMRRLVRRRVRRLRRAGVETDMPGAAAPRNRKQPTKPDRWAAEPDPVQAAVDEIAGLAQTAIDLRRRLRETR